MRSSRQERTVRRRGPGAIVGAIVSLLAMSLFAPRAEAEIRKGNVTIKLETVAAGLTGPEHLTHAGDGSGRLFIVDQAGQIRIVKNGVLLSRPFLDLTALLPALNPGFDERGLLGLAFHPDYVHNGRFFVRYSAPRAGSAGEPCFGTTRGCHEEILAEFGVSSDPDLANPGGRILFRVDKPQFNHNSGTVAFGPDGFLYFTLGDGGGANDGLADNPPSHGPFGNAQNIEVPLGKILRLDVDSPPQAPRPYATPADNPFLGRDGLDEIYAYGLRNPFRFAFDDGPGGDGTLWLADVGQNLFEEVDTIVNGGNYGWVIREGSHCFDPFNPLTPPASCSSTGAFGEPFIEPIVDYSHAEGGISVIGGYVYRGTRSPDLTGKYVFGDFSASFGAPGGRLYFLERPDPDSFAIREFVNGPGDRPYGLFLKGFGEDQDREVYALGSTALAPTGNTGVVQRIVEVVNPVLDIKPGSCPARLNGVARGVLPMALLGTPGFDVNTIDTATLRLTRGGSIVAFTATIDGAQAGTGSTATGHGSATLDTASNLLCTDVRFSGLLGTQTNQHYHGPATRADNASVIIQLPGPGNFTNYCTTISDANERTLLAGLSYINIHSTRNPGGEIRGQVLPASVAPVRVHVEDVGTPSGEGACGCQGSEPDGIPDLVLQFDNQEVFSALRLRSGGDAPDTLAVSGHRLPRTGSGPTRFEFDMDGSQEVPPNISLGRAACGVTLDEATGNVSVGCTYEGMTGITAAAHIHGLAQPGVNASVIVPLTEIGDRSGTITGGGTLTPAQVQGMLDGLTYVNLHTDFKPGGEIRGQIAGGEKFGASDCVQVIRSPESRARTTMRPAATGAPTVRRRPTSSGPR